MANYEVKLKDGNDVLYPQGMGVGIDTNNIVFDYRQEYGSLEVTIPEDAFIYVDNGGTSSIYIDDVEYWSTTSWSKFYGFVKRGQVVKATNTTEIKGWGIKH